MMFHLTLLHRNNGYFASVFIISVGLKKSTPSISGVYLTISGVALILW